MAGYTRQDTANNIANGNVIDADDFDAEYNAVENAFNASTGHKHDGSAGEGAPIEKVGPSQELVVSSTNVNPKTSNTLDLGTNLLQYKDGYFDGTVYQDSAIVGVNAYMTLSDNEIDVSTGGLTLDAAGDITLDADGGDILLKDAGTTFGTFTNTGNNLVVKSGSTTSITLSGADATLAGTLAVTGATTLNGAVTVSGSNNVTVNAGDVTLSSGDLIVGGTITSTGAIVANGGVTGNVTGTVSSISNHDTGDLSEGSNLYHTTARARGAISVTDAGGDGSLSYNSTSGVITYTGPSAAQVRAHFSAGGGIGISNGSISHSDTSSQTSVNGSGRTYIQDITLDTYGHVTGLSTATETVVNTNTTYSAGGGLSLSGTTFSHTDTSSQGSVNNSGATVIQDVTLDGYGHITGLSSVNLDGRYYTESESDGRFASTSRTISAGGGLTGGGNLTANRTISHSDTSSQGSVNNSGNTVIQDISVDGYGHVTSIGSTALSIPSGNSLSTGNGAWTDGSGGLQIRYGTVSSTLDGAQSFSFTSAFSSACLVCVVGGEAQTTAVSRTGFTIDRENDYNGTFVFQYIALGY